MTATEDEKAVVDYLLLLNNPDELVDQAAVEDCRKRLAETTDPVERVRLRGELEKAETPDVDGIEAAFVKHAGRWAKANGVDVQAFTAEGVEKKVLRRAGFTVPRAKKRTAKKKGV